MSHRQQYILIVLVAVLLVPTIMLSRPKQGEAPTNQGNVNEAVMNQNVPTNTSTTKPSGIAFSTDDVPDAANVFQFSTRLPERWIADFVAGEKTLTFYDPKVGVGPATIIVQKLTQSTYPTGPGTATSVTVAGQAGKKYQGTTTATIQKLASYWKVGQTYTQIDIPTSATAKAFYHILIGSGVTKAQAELFQTEFRLTD